MTIKMYTPIIICTICANTTNRSVRIATSPHPFDE
jgi:hypothetical protein